MRVAAWRSAYYALAEAMISSNVGDLDRFRQMMVEPSRWGHDGERGQFRGRANVAHDVEADADA
jgi:hypothetical protein